MFRKWWLGEFLGTFLLVFFGCGSLASAVTSGSFSGIGQVATVWALGIGVSIYLTASLSGAHLNPAVTLGLVFAGRFPSKMVLPYVAFQFFGAFTAAAVIYLVFQDSIVAFETVHAISRGELGSEKSAMIFTEFYANPTVEVLAKKISVFGAMLAEGIGTFILVLVILSLTDVNNRERPKEIGAVLIGITVGLLICLFGPISMAGFNPARDLAPRLFAYFAGWGSFVFRVQGFGWFTVYVLSPCLGSACAAGLYRILLANTYSEPLSQNESIAFKPNIVCEG